MQRRRFIKILATSAATLPLGKLVLASNELKAARWNGYTLGAEGSITLFNSDSAQANSVLKQCFAEVRRLEKLFSLYDDQSELSILNRKGVLQQPSKEWQTLLKAVDSAYTLTGGLFDPTIQPLWKAYQVHFETHPNATEGPKSIPGILDTTGWQHVQFNSNEIRFEQPEMQLTLNGIAQGFITDRISELLKRAGYEHVLIELGETRAIGAHPEGRAWTLGIKYPENPTRIADCVELDNQALATSGGYGSPFSNDGKFHHLIHPKTGQPATRWKSLSVTAPTAVEADALSTGLSFVNTDKIEELERQHPRLRILKQA
ncbi:MAG: FAD:protein FMN transferase [Opitutaceae bacterium]